MDLDTFSTKSGRTIYSTGFHYEENDSSLGFEDFYYLDDKSFAGSIMQSPSATKHSVTALNRNIGDFRTSFQAMAALKSAL